MLIPYSVTFPNRPHRRNTVAWNDPVRTLFPHHAEFWPQETPEHVMFEEKARELARSRRKRLLDKLLPGFLRRKPGRQGASSCGPLCHFEKQPETFGAA